VEKSFGGDNHRQNCGYRLEADIWETLSLISRDQVTALSRLTDLSEHTVLMALSGLMARGIVQRAGNHERVSFILQQRLMHQ
jgi:hypothetical protein